MQPLRTVAFIVNESKPGATEVARQLEAIARRLGAEVRNVREYPIVGEDLAGCDACCAIGGDGTLLGVAAEAARRNIPVIGVNRGSLGFLTTFTPEEAIAQFEALLQGQYKLACRSLLQCSTGPGQTGLALNDVLIKDQQTSKLVKLEVHADGELVTDYHSDGLIFSTPTGSTAYNLSAGGPLIHPSAEVIAMTPICPHTLSNRTIIFHHNVKLRVGNLNSASTLLVALDGQRHLIPCGEHPIEISKATVTLPLVQRMDYAHFAVVRTKLNWSGGYVTNT
ncbi:MAG: NAD(+)/NADH kinase [Opitutaceae bacterium]|nr:NAD(+)/NADH kinase [Opitutaceae bacterium]